MPRPEEQDAFALEMRQQITLWLLRGKPLGDEHVTVIDELISGLAKAVAPMPAESQAAILLLAVEQFAEATAFFEKHRAAAQAKAMIARVS